jgi:asparagine synthase (glutamine-hydrolysing)
MCGIAGFNFNDSRLVEKMTTAIAHRGPDDRGSYLDDSVSLGHCRLSIIDTSPRGRQPMQFENLVITYNGEVYNFRELRTQLESKGYNFRSDTDTEVVLLAYHCWGPSCVEKFNGMWSFCIYDSKQRTLFLSRDRFGIKPLYYYFDGKRFVFASELKAIRRHDLPLVIDTDGVNRFFYQKYIGGKRTIFDNCFKLEPGHNLMFDLQRRSVAKTRYYHLEEEISLASDKPLDERLALVGELLTDAVEKRLIADVPVGSFLSGGVDSSVISAMIARTRKDFKTFSIGFKDRSYDEVPYSQKVAGHIGTDHHVEYLDIDENLIAHVIGMMDEPFGDSSVLPTYLLSQMTRKSVTVSLSGDGGDEVFAGYDSYQAWNIARFLPRAVVGLAKPVVRLLPPSEKKLTTAFKIRKFADSFGTDVNRRHLDWMSTFADGDRSRLLGGGFIASDGLFTVPSGGSLLSVQLNDIANYLAEDILKKVDLASMLNSLEVRVPFLDYRLVPTVLSLPDSCKIRYFKMKWLLKKIASDYLPAAIVNRKKRGFTVPVSRWIRHSDMIRQFITQRGCYHGDLVDYDYAQSLLADHLDRKADNARQLWLIFVFNKWCDSAIRGGR